PTRFTCDGEGISPEVDWSGAPAAAVTLAMTVIDPDAGGFVHWLVYDLPAASAGSLAENVGTGAGAPPQGANGRGKAGYTGPCPPSGTHHYVFTLYALDRTLGLTRTPSYAEIEAALKYDVLAATGSTATHNLSRPEWLPGASLPAPQVVATVETYAGERPATEGSAGG